MATKGAGRLDYHYAARVNFTDGGAADYMESEAMQGVRDYTANAQSSAVTLLKLLYIKPKLGFTPCMDWGAAIPSIRGPTQDPGAAASDPSRETGGGRPMGREAVTWTCLVTARRTATTARHASRTSTPTRKPSEEYTTSAMMMALLI
jgi:hypothetical protein